MKAALAIAVISLVVTGEALTLHRSFRNGYPSGSQGVSVRREPSQAVLTPPKTKTPKPSVVTNRVVLTKAEAEKLLKSKKGLKMKTVKVPVVTPPPATPPADALKNAPAR